MDWFDAGGYVGVFLGGAIPWLEAVLVIPAGIVAGLDPVAVVALALAGNLLTIAVAAWSGEHIRRWWLVRRGRSAHPSDRRDRRVRRVARRWGMPGLAILGPIGLGTQLSAMVAVGLGVSARGAFIWIGIATICWGILAAVATQASVQLLA
jgi:uncharacterized membrane protein